MIDILNRIVDTKKQEIAQRKASMPLDRLIDSTYYHRTCHSLAEGLTRAGSSGIIAEFKRRSPSKRDINLDADCLDVVAGYVQAGAAAVSILTDEIYFGGSDEYLRKVRESFPLARILRKEFIIDEYQVHEAKAIGADAILLIAEILHPNQVSRLSELAHSIGLEILLELHSADQVSKYCSTVSMIGVNNRDLKDFTVDFDRSKKLYDLLPDDKPKVAESGLSNAKTIHMLKEYGFDGFLIGEYFMKQKNPGSACARLIHELKEMSDFANSINSSISP